MSSRGNQKQHDMYIHQLPHTERHNLCRILDQNNKWEELAGTHMNYEVLKIQELRRQDTRGKSPSDELLTDWGMHNHTVLELFVLLSRMKHYQAMTEIKHFVDPCYHSLMQNHCLERLMEQLKVKPCAPTDTVRAAMNPPAPPPYVAAATPEEKILNNGTRVPVLRPAPPVPVVAAASPADPVVAPLVAVTNQDSPAVPAIQPTRATTTRSPAAVPALDKLLSSKANTGSAISCVVESAGAIPQIAYEELQRATNDWDMRTVLGRGGFGTVFKGTWKCTEVAIKRIEERKDKPESHIEQIKQSITELHCLNAYRHDNVLPLYGYSVGGPQPCLVYQYMCGGCLDRRLRTSDPNLMIDWPTRLNIAIGTARGLQFLHTIGPKPLIHGDIKSANILLDRNNTPRIGDFGLAREGPPEQYTHITATRIHGTRPYLPDEVLRARRFSTKVDTYSFGVVLFEMATGLTAYVASRPPEHRFLRDYVLACVEAQAHDALRDPRCPPPRSPSAAGCFSTLVGIGVKCVQRRAKDRPEMVHVLIELEQSRSQ